MDLVLTSRPVSARKELQMGLANNVVPRGMGLKEATKLAWELLSFPQACMNADRRSVYYAAYNVRLFEDALVFEFKNGVLIMVKESIKGASRFRAGAGHHRKFGDSKL
jgi:enoyl-CoA hydratase/carnithine racemase